MKQPLVPMKAVIGTEKDFDKKGVIFEPKLDGIRALCYVNNDLTFYSRNQIDITNDYPEFQFRESIKAQSAILDGEIVVVDEGGRPEFALWQQGYEAQYIVFDILEYNGKNLLDTPLLERKKLLEKVVKKGPHIESCYYTHDGHALLKEMRKRSMEGVIAKEAQSLYYPGKRRKAWTKIKLYKTLEALIIGYTTKKRELSSLVLGMYKKHELVYIGKVGTGFTEDVLKKLLSLLESYKSEQSVAGTYKDIEWVAPKLVCEIKYVEFTKDGVLRTPVFLRLRPDKKPQEASFEEQKIRV